MHTNTFCMSQHIIRGLVCVYVMHTDTDTDTDTHIVMTSYDML